MTELFGVNNSSFWLRSDDEIASLKQAVESAIHDFSYYPEMEWDRYGFRPPEGRPFYGAWRNEDRTAFIYLVGETASSDEIKMLLMVTAQGDERRRLLMARFRPVTETFRLAERQALKRHQHNKTAAEVTETFANKSVVGMYAAAALVLVAVSSALRSIAPPNSQFQLLNQIYDATLMVVHLVALTSLLLAGFFLLLFFARHIVGIVRRS